jgi:2-polyprenyl-3-methyl-5-hydroxy-6-metoxy-1,4-benzoquinol methylase
LLPDDWRKARRPTNQKSLLMAQWLCPPWIGYLIASPLRRLFHKPEQILAGLVAPGMTVADAGPGMGFFTLPMARMVGPNGTVVCVDVQEAMLRSLRKRAAAARLADRIITRVCSPTSLGVTDFAGKMDFVLVFAVVHELPDVSSFFAEVAQALKPDAQCLVAEPARHVSTQAFEETLAAAGQAGLTVVGRPHIRWCYGALLGKGR